MTAVSPHPGLTKSLFSRLHLEPAQAILTVLLVLEIAVFSLIGTNFASLANGFEVLRLCVEIGLLALAVTPVITSGGNDLYVGSLRGGSAVGVAAERAG
jgi:rhamnose transport system permease protein